MVCLKVKTELKIGLNEESNKGKAVIVYHVFGDYLWEKDGKVIYFWNKVFPNEGFELTQIRPIEKSDPPPDLPKLEEGEEVPEVELETKSKEVASEEEDRLLLLSFVHGVNMNKEKLELPMNSGTFYQLIIYSNRPK